MENKEVCFFNLKFFLVFIFMIFYLSNVSSAEELPLINEGNVYSFGNNYTFFDSGEEVLFLSFSSGFEINKDLIVVKIKPGDVKRETLELTNPTSDLINIVINPDIEEVVAISERIFKLKPGEKKIINLDFFARDDQASRNFVGSLRVASGSFYKNINLIVEVQERKPLFDVLVDVENLEYSPGEKVESDIEIINMGDLHNIDILLHYSVRDFEDGTIVFLKEESLAINKSLNLEREIDLPNDMESGLYEFSVFSTYKEIFASGKDTFEIVNNFENVRNFVFSNDYFLVIFTALITTVIVLIIFNLFLRFFISIRESKSRKKKSKSKMRKKSKNKESNKNKSSVYNKLEREVGKI